MLVILGRAAGLSSLALATMASGPCGPCTEADECTSVEDLRAAREEGLERIASAGASGGGSTNSFDEGPKNIESATSWDGEGCPRADQYRGIVQLKLPGRYSDSTVTTKDLGNGKCCYHVVGDDCSEGGRPFLVRGEARVASLPKCAEEPHAWLADAQMEHASVAAFARLSLHLLALGAPAELVRDAQLASLDELRHADFFFELASREAGVALRPGKLDVAGALDDLSLAGLIESNLLEGCIGETLAAEQLRARAALASSELKAALLAIAEDETTHAELAFRILGWCRDVAPELTRQILRRVLDDEQPRRGREEAWQHVLSPLFGALC